MTTPTTDSTQTADYALWRDVVILRRKVERSLEQRLQGDASISVADFEILSTLATAADSRLRARDLAEILGWEKSRLSHQVTRMQARQLVAREECPVDLRGTWIVVTEAGHSAVAAAFEGHAEVLREHFGALDDGEKAELDGAIVRVIQSTDPSACDLAEKVFSGDPA